MLMNAETQHHVMLRNTCYFSIISKIKLAPADECLRAAEIYECGKKKAPGVTDAIQRQMTGDLSTAAAVFIYNKSEWNILVFKRIISLGEQPVSKSIHRPEIL
jgi:hypothetical protein